MMDMSKILSPSTRIATKHNAVKTIFKSFVGGFIIGVACLVSSKYSHPELIFPVGLICIIYSNNLLYTGCVGHYALNKRNIYIILLGNLIGTILCTFCISIGNLDVINTIGQIKYSESLITCFISSIFCGMLMCTATSLNSNKHFLCIFLCVAAFVAGGLDHSIANSFYLVIYKLDVNSILRIVVYVVGNAVGAKMLYLSHSMKVNQ